MKVNELTGYKSKPEYQAIKDGPQLFTLQKKLEDLGYKKFMLGSGIFGIVYARPEDNFVLKIYSTDRGYEAFLRFIKDHSGSPFVPKLRGKPMRVGRYKLVRIEKLTELPLNDYMAVNHFLYSTSPMLRKVSTTELDTKFPGLTAFLTDLKADAKQKHMGLDLHMGNIMMRGNTPVVIDPYIEK